MPKVRASSGMIGTMPRADFLVAQQFFEAFARIAMVVATSWLPDPFFSAL